MRYSKSPKKYNKTLLRKGASIRSGKILLPVSADISKASVDGEELDMLTQPERPLKNL